MEICPLNPHQRQDPKKQLLIKSNKCKLNMQMGKLGIRRVWDVIESGTCFLKKVNESWNMPLGLNFYLIPFEW
jgi:hypothetical protein